MGPSTHSYSVSELIHAKETSGRQRLTAVEGIKNEEKNEKTPIDKTGTLRAERKETASPTMRQMKGEGDEKIVIYIRPAQRPVSVIL